jgi:hypothetical protein
MIAVNNWHNLEQLGVKILTGESDRTYRQALCDLTDGGRELFRVPSGPSPVRCATRARDRC